MRRWADAHPDYRWAPYPPGPPLVLRDRVAALDAAVGESQEPAVLIAHSGGCITAVAWAAAHAGPVRAALLVTPPHLDGFEPDDPSDLPWAVPRGRLPFRAVVVASRTDPYTTMEQFERYAEDWGAELVDAGEVGHLDTAAGFGPWPDGERLVRELG
jgi:predicted alpha/beta hydrolase family esterase